MTQYYNEEAMRTTDDHLMATNGHYDHTKEDNMVALDFPMTHSSAGNSHSVCRRTHEEEIYEDLCYVTLRLGRDRDKCLGSIPLEPREKRDYCVKELVETEKNYCEALNMIVTHFLQPLSKIMRTNHRKTIFMHIKHLCDVHSRFYADLCHNCQASTGPSATTPGNSPGVNSMNSSPGLSQTPTSCNNFKISDFHPVQGQVRRLRRVLCQPAQGSAADRPAVHRRRDNRTGSGQVPAEGQRRQVQVA